MMKIKKMSPARFISFSFIFMILLGTILLSLPFMHNEGVEVSLIDALFTSTSAVCVTGLIAIDTADTFNVFGRTIVALLIQIGGLGVTSVGVCFIFIARKTVDFKDRILVKEALGLGSMRGIVKIVKSILFITLGFEAVGTILSFIVFSKDYAPFKALGISVFHSIAAFNNSGFDILGEYQNLIPYQNNILLNLTTSGLIVFGGLGFVVIKELFQRRKFNRLSLHSRIVITVSLYLLIIGTVLIKFTEDISWLGAFFFSVSTRTAGFSTYSVGNFTNGTLFVLIMLMFFGASPGSTGGGIKTTTTLVLFKGAISMSTNRHCTVFKRKIPLDIIFKSYVIAFLAMAVVCFNTLLLCIIESNYTFIQVLFEVVSAFGTVGLSTGITPNLTDPSKFIIVVTMFIGRVGPFTLASVWAFKKKSNVTFSEEGFTVG